MMENIRHHYKIWSPGICSPLSLKCHTEYIYSSTSYSTEADSCAMDQAVTWHSSQRLSGQTMWDFFFFTEWIGTGTGVVWALWFFLSASFRQWFIL